MAGALSEMYPASEPLAAADYATGAGTTSAAGPALPAGPAPLTAWWLVRQQSPPGLFGILCLWKIRLKRSACCKASLAHWMSPFL